MHVGVGELEEREAAVGCGVGHPVEVTIEDLEGEVSGGCGGCCQRHMKCKQVGREQGAWRCCGGGDAVDQDGSGCAAEDAPPLPCRAFFTLERERMGAEGRLPRGPRVVGAGEAVPVGALLREASCGKEQAGGDRGNLLVVNRELCPERLLLRVLEKVDVLGDARVVGPPSERGGEEGDDVGGFKAAAAALESGKKVAERNLVIKGGLLLEWEEPGVFNDGDEERAPGAFDCLDQSMQFNLGQTEAFGLGSYGIVSVGGDAVVVCLEGDLHAFERLVAAKFRLVVLVRKEDAG